MVGPPVLMANDWSPLWANNVGGLWKMMFGALCYGGLKSPVEDLWGGFPSNNIRVHIVGCLNAWWEHAVWGAL